MNAKTVLKYASDQGAKFVSVRFTDLPGSWQHLTFPIGELAEDSFEDGFGFDASSIRGWAAIHESDMLLVPDPYRFWMDPFSGEPTLCLVANAVDPISRQGYAFDPRIVAVRAESYLKSAGIADIAVNPAKIQPGGMSRPQKPSVFDRHQRQITARNSEQNSEKQPATNGAELLPSTLLSPGIAPSSLGTTRFEH